MKSAEQVRNVYLRVQMWKAVYCYIISTYLSRPSLSMQGGVLEGVCPADEGSKESQTGKDRQTANTAAAAGPVYDRKKEVLLSDEMGLRSGGTSIIALYCTWHKYLTYLE